jgi:hypothetical protein
MLASAGGDAVSNGCDNDDVGDGCNSGDGALSKKICTHKNHLYTSSFYMY